MTILISGLDLYSSSSAIRLSLPLLVPLLLSLIRLFELLTVVLLLFPFNEDDKDRGKPDESNDDPPPPDAAANFKASFSALSFARCASIKDFWSRMFESSHFKRRVSGTHSSHLFFEQDGEREERRGEGTREWEVGEEEHKQHADGV